MGKRGLFAVALLVFDFTLFVSPLTGRPRDRAPNSRRNEVPFDLYAGYLMLVKGDIGPLQNVVMIVDTGTDPTIVNTEVADKLGLHGAMASQLTARGEVVALTASLPSIKIGGLRADSLRVVVQDLSFLQRNFGISVAAIVGVDLLRVGNFTIDYQHRKIIFGYAAACRHSVPLESGASPLIVKMRIADQQLRLLVDSGTPAVLLYGDRAIVPIDHLQDDATMVTPGGTLRSRWFVASRVTLGGQSLGRQTVLIANSERAPAHDFDGLLGLVMTGFRTVSVDFENMLLRWD
jgi:predicted aspartyl protease